MVIGLERVDVKITHAAALADHHLHARRTAHDHRVLGDALAVDLVVVKHAHDLVAVARVDDVRLPVDRTEFLVDLQRKLDTFVVDPTAVDIHARLGRGGGDRGLEDLVQRAGVVVGSADDDLVAPQADIGTHLPRFRALGFVVLGREEGRRLRTARRNGIGRHGDVAHRGVTYLGIRSADLGVGEHLGLYAEDVGHYGRETHRRIEHREALGIDQRRGPVVSARQIEEDHVAEAQLNGGEYRLGLIVVGRLRTGLVGGHVA